MTRSICRRPWRLLLTAGAAVSALVLSACSSSGSGSSTAEAGASGGAASAKLVTVKFAGPNSPNGVFSQVAYGLEEGIFKKHGINLQLSYPSVSTGSTLPLLANNTFNIGVDSPADIIAAAAKGTKTIAIFASDEADADGIAMKKSSGITTLKDLEGKTLGIPTGSTEGEEVKNIMTAGGADPSTVKFVGLAYAALFSALMSNKIDGIVAYAYAYDALMQAENVTNADILFKDHGSHAISGVFVAGASWAKANPNAVKNFDAAMEEATKGAIAHPEQAAKDLVATAPGSAPTEAATLLQWKNNLPYLKSAATQGKPYGYMAASDWQASLDFAKKYAGFTGSADLSQLYTNEYIPQS